MLVGPSEGWVGEWVGILSFTFCKHPTFLFHVFLEIIVFIILIIYLLPHLFFMLFLVDVIQVAELVLSYQGFKQVLCRLILEIIVLYIHIITNSVAYDGNKYGY